MFINQTQQANGRFPKFIDTVNHIPSDKGFDFLDGIRGVGPEQRENTDHLELHAVRNTGAQQNPATKQTSQESKSGVIAGGEYNKSFDKKPVPVKLSNGGEEPNITEVYEKSLGNNV